LAARADIVTVVFIFLLASTAGQVDVEDVEDATV
jgi:hypothetical protein